MPSYKEKTLVPYRPEQLFDLVANVGDYPHFLPWCVGARVRSRSDSLLIADLTIGFGPFRESFTSRVTLERPRRILVAYENGPFKYLKNQWIFIPEASATRVDFFVDFEFRSRLLQKAGGMVFFEAVRRMVVAFRKRASEVYGPPLYHPTRAVAPPQPLPH
ncbi:MAG: type II toxin-antitoxin system RatA family toxin [Acetobacteraceae bacterium]